MFQCCECKASLASHESYLAHIQFYHPAFQKRSRFQCGFLNCTRDFDKFNSFRRHAADSHRHVDCMQPVLELNAMEVDDTDLDLVDSEEQTSLPGCSVDGLLPLESPNDCLRFDKAVTSSIVMYISKLYEAGLTETQVQSVIQNHMRTYSMVLFSKKTF